MRKVAGRHPFCVLIYMNSYIFHICFVLFILMSYLKFDFVCLTESLANMNVFQFFIICKRTNNAEKTMQKWQKCISFQGMASVASDMGWL